MRPGLMIAFSVVTVCAVLTAAMVEAAPKRAGSPQPSPEDGTLVGLHELRREGGKICMVDHFHSGASAGHATRRAAEIAAQQSWSSFTALEYGNHWGYPSLAASKSMSCTSNGSTHGCDFFARPCKRST